MQLLRTTAMAAAAAALVIALGGSARAQDEAWPNKPLRVKVGGYFPYDGDTRDALGSNFIAFGLGYDFKRVSSFLPATLEAYVDHFRRPRTTGDIGRVEATMLGFGVASRFALIREPRGYNPYVGAGLGVYFNRVRVNDTEGNFASTQRISLGGKFLAGTELRGGVFGEAEFNFVPHPSVFDTDVSLSGWQLRIGYRF